MHNTGKQKQENECKTQYENINSPNWSPYVFLQYWLREFVKRSKQFLFGDPLSILIRALIGWVAMLDEGNEYESIAIAK